LRPLGWRCERGGGFLNGESEDGGRLELWLSLLGALPAPGYARAAAQ